MAKIEITLSESEIRTAIANYLESVWSVSLDPASLPLLVRSKQNYRAEWEPTSAEVTIKVDGVAAKKSTWAE